MADRKADIARAISEWEVMNLLRLAQPTAKVESIGDRGVPKYSGGVSVPMGEGRIGVEGSAFKADKQAPLDWDVRFNYTRPF